jgi:hypothetical protein
VGVLCDFVLHTCMHRVALRSVILTTWGSIWLREEPNGNVKGNEIRSHFNQIWDE